MLHRHSRHAPTLWPKPLGCCSACCGVPFCCCPACRTLIQQIYESSCAFFKQNPAQKHAQLVIGGSVKQAIHFTRETTVEDHNLLIPERQALELVLSEVCVGFEGWCQGLQEGKSAGEGAQLQECSAPNAGCEH